MYYRFNTASVMCDSQCEGASRDIDVRQFCSISGSRKLMVDDDVTRLFRRVLVRFVARVRSPKICALPDHPVLAFERILHREDTSLCVVVSLGNHRGFLRNFTRRHC